MKIYKECEINLKDFEASPEARETLNELTDEQICQLELGIIEIFNNKINETALNDFLRFDKDFIATILGFTDWEDLLYGDEEAQQAEEDQYFYRLECQGGII